MVKRKRWLLLAAVISALSFGAGTASANFWLSGDVFDNGTICVGNITAMQQSYASVQVNSKTNYAYGRPSYNCSYNRSVPSGYLAAMWQTYKYVWNPYGNWALCGQQGWDFGGGTSMVVGRGLNGCGSAWYFIQGGTYVKNGDAWLGGWLSPASSQWFNY